MSKRNTQQELVDWLATNPCKTEKEICNEAFNSKRKKKHAELLRRALHSGKIDRIRVKFKGESRMLWRYFIK